MSKKQLPPPSPPQPPIGDNKTYRDCIQGICSINCPQFCTFLLFPPPPPFFLSSATSNDDSDSNRISPLMAALIASLAVAFILLFYFTVITRHLRRRRHRHLRRRHRHLRRHLSDVTSSSPDIRLDPMVQDPPRPSGLDDSFIRQITVFKYRRGDGLVEGTECAVCLSEFSENERLRLMPNCEHAFHIPCIDTWLRSHSNCPLCRSGLNLDPVRSDPSRTGGVTLAHMRIQRSNDAVLVVREEEGEVIVCDDVEERENDEIKSDHSPLLI